MYKRVSEIVSEFSEWSLFASHSEPDNLITGMPNIKKSGEGHLVFVENENYVDYVFTQKPSAVVTNEKLAGKFKNLTDTALLVSSNPKLAQALLRQKYVDRDVRRNGWLRIHPSAVIHESVNVPESVTVGPNVVISENVRIGENTVVMANAVIEECAVIGNDTVIHPNATIAYECVIGDRCFIKSGAVIGMEGFGFAQDAQQRSYRVPQLGNVVIGNDVVIGANCTIDRATYDSTQVADGCKFDTHVHVAHNVLIEEDCLFVSQTGIAGSTKIGKRVRCSGQTGILDHLTISDDTAFVQRAAVVKNVKEPGVYAGSPLMPLRAWFKNAVIMKQLIELKKIISRIEKTALK